MLRLPPRSPEGEVIGILLTEPTHLTIVSQGLAPEDFEEPTAKAAYLAILDMAQQGQVPTAFALQSRMPTPEAADQLWLWKTDALVANLQAAIRDIKERTAWRRCRHELTQLMSQYDRLDPIVIPDKLLAMAGMLDRVLQPTIDPAITRRSTGIPQLDEILGGGWPTDAIIQIEGAHGSGRSALLNALLQRGTPPGKTSLLALTDSCLSASKDDVPGPSSIALTNTLTSLSHLVLECRVRPEAKPYQLIGLDSVHGLHKPEPTATDWRQTVRRLRAPLILVTNLMNQQSVDLNTSADVVLSMRKGDVACFVHRNRLGPASLSLHWKDLKSPVSM